MKLTVIAGTVAGLLALSSPAYAAPVTVDLRIEGTPGQGLTIEVRNPTPVGAAGASEIPGSGTGLVGLAERAALTGGRLDHGFDRRGDLYLRAWLPWA